MCGVGAARELHSRVTATTSEFHDIPTTSDRGHRHAAADRLSKRHQVWGHTIKGAGVLGCVSEAGYHLVMDEHNAVFLGEFSRQVHVFPGRRKAATGANYGFQKETSEPISMLLERVDQV